MPYLKQAYPSSVKQLTDESFLVSGGAPMCRHQSCELYSEKKTRTKKSGITLLRGYVAQRIFSVEIKYSKIYGIKHIYKGSVVQVDSPCRQSQSETGAGWRVQGSL